MKHLLPSLLALAASLLSAAPILVQDFEDTSLFRCGPTQRRQVGLSKELYGNWLGFNGKDAGWRERGGAEREKASENRWRDLTNLENGLS